MTKQETLAALKNPGEIYVIMSGATRLPFVSCDEETFDDEVFLYYRVEDAKGKAKELLEKKYAAAVVKLEDKQLLAFYTSLYTMGVNCLAVNSGTDTQINIQLSDLVMRRQAQPQPTEELKELQEELLAHYGKGTFVIAVREDGQLPILKQKDGTVYQPLFTDMLEFQKFARGEKMRTAVVPAAKIPEILINEAKGVVINPFGVNVQLQVAKRKQPAQEA